MNEPLTPAQRSLRSRMAAYASWANTDDPVARTAPARRAATSRFEHLVDPEGVLDPVVRQRRAQAAHRAHMTDLAYRSSRARQARQSAMERGSSVAESTASSVWSRIVAHEGETFTQIRGGEFSYDISGDHLIKVDRTNQAIPRKQIEGALTLVALVNTVAVQHLRAPSCVYAILMDRRIRMSDW